jgi:XTP/dITP diphosphohydrolase
MKKILFVTSNAGKVTAFNNRLLNTDFIAEQVIVDLPEIQANSATDISIYKAKEAYKKLRKPLIVQDSSFHVKKLGGFPGPYIKYMQETIGNEGLLRLMDGQTDRACYFDLALTYIQDENTLITFNKSHALGTLAMKEQANQSGKAWGIIWKVYIPEWSNGKTLAELTPQEIDEHESKHDADSEFAQFVNWLNLHK